MKILGSKWISNSGFQRIIDLLLKQIWIRNPFFLKVVKKTQGRWTKYLQ